MRGAAKTREPVERPVPTSPGGENTTKSSEMGSRVDLYGRFASLDEIGQAEDDNLVLSTDCGQAWIELSGETERVTRRGRVGWITGWEYLPEVPDSFVGWTFVPPKRRARRSWANRDVDPISGGLHTTVGTEGVEDLVNSWAKPSTRVFRKPNRRSGGGVTAKTKRPKRHTTDRAINGNNGEWTNGDDMAALNIANIGHQLGHLQVVNGHQLHAGRVNPPAGGFVPVPAGQPHFHQRQRARAPAPAAVAPPADAPKVVLMVMQDIGLQRQYACHGTTFNIYEAGVDKFVDHKGTTYDYVHEGQVVHNCVESGPGYVVTQARKGGDVVARGCTARYTHQSLGGPSKGSKGHYLIPLFISLNSEFPVANMTSSCVNGMRAFICKRYQGLSHELKHLSLLTINHVCYAKDLEFYTLGGTPSVAKHMGLVSAPKLETWERVTSYAEYELEGPIFLKSVEVQGIPVDWSYRTDFRVVQNRGFETHDFAPNTIPYFHTQFDDMLHADKNQRVQYFRLRGASEFQTYGNTPANACYALKRIIGARDNEAVLNQAQETVAFKLMRNIINTKQPARMLAGAPFCERVAHMGGYELNTNVEPAVYQRLHDDPRDDIEIGENDEFDHLLWSAVENLCLRCNRTVVESFTDKLKNCEHWAYYKGFEAYLTCYEAIVSRQYNSNIPHVKRELRRAYVKGVLLHWDQDTMVKQLNAKVKMELAKPGKVPRLFVTYEAGCMYANELPEYIKVCLDGTHWNTCGDVEMYTIIVGKMRTGVLDEVFQHIITGMDAPDDMIFNIIYSDDSCVSGVLCGTPFCFNRDISSCDASNRILTFFIIILLLSNFHTDRALGLGEQCTKPITVDNPINRDEKLILQMNGFFLGSGSVLTTVLNHIASYLCCLGFLYEVHMHRGMFTDRAHIARMLMDGAARVGYVVTLEDCFIENEFVLERLQFLKHSPMRTQSGKVVIQKNLGTIFHSLGQSDKILTPQTLCVTPEEFHSMSYDMQIDHYWSGVMKGNVHMHADTVVSALRARFNMETAIKVRDDSVLSVLGREFEEMLTTVPQGSGAEDPITDESLCNRYGLEEYDLVELLSAIRQIHVGYTKPLTALTKIFERDYGLK